MIDDRQIHAAFAADAEAAHLPADLLSRIQRELSTPAVRRPWWRRIRAAHLLEVAAACVVMGVMIALAVAGPGARHLAGDPPGQQPPAAGTLSLDQVVSVFRVYPGPGGLSRQVDLAQPAEREQVERLLAAIAAAEPIDPTGADSYNPRARVGSINVELKGDQRIQVRPAMYCEAIEDGGSRCQTLLDKQVISRGAELDTGIGMVVASHELAAILQTPDWPGMLQVTLSVHQLPDTSPVDMSKPLPTIPGALVEVVELGIRRQTNEAGEVTFGLSPGIYTFRAIVPESPYTSTYKQRIDGWGGTRFMLLHNSDRDTSHDYSTPPVRGPETWTPPGPPMPGGSH